MFQMIPSLPLSCGNKRSLPIWAFRSAQPAQFGKRWGCSGLPGPSYFLASHSTSFFFLSAARSCRQHGRAPRGEEFNAFNHFWVEKDGTAQHSIVILLLLERFGNRRLPLQTYTGFKTAMCGPERFPSNGDTSHRHRAADPLFLSTKRTLGRSRWMPSEVP